MKINLITVSLILCLNHCNGKQYYHYKLFRGIPKYENHTEFFKNLASKFDVNYWKFPGAINMPVDFVISPEDQPAFLLEAERHGVYLTTIIEDVQKAFDKQTVNTYVRRNMDSFNWNSYFRLNDIYQWLRDLQKVFPAQMEIQIIGKTEENRDIMAVKILHNKLHVRSRVIVEGGIHAREWISTAFVTYLIHQILHGGHSSNRALKTIATTYEWYFIPVLNPDGYEYSHTKDRLWRKNRSDNHGVDLNRNFDSAFGTVGISYHTQSEVYCGNKPFSEKESRALLNFLRSKSENLEYYVSFHSYGQFIIIPYAYTTGHNDNFQEVNDMCKQTSYYISAKYGTKYTTGTAYDTVGYVASGVSTCWVKKAFHVPYVITFELRDTGYDGFALPTDKIMPTCNETMDGIVSFLTPRTHSFIKPHYEMFSGQMRVLNKFMIICSGILIEVCLGYLLQCV